MVCGCWILAVAAVMAAQTRPSIEVVRSESLSYAQRLPDFICTEIVQQSSSVGRYTHPGDRLQIQLSYFQQHEKYKLLTINGNPTDRPFESLGGLISGGEFGSMLLRIFEPESAAEFEWKGWTKVGKRRAGAYSYRVDVAHSHHVVGYHTESGELRTATVGQRGVIDVDLETCRVLRLSVEAEEIPRDFPVVRSSTRMEYAFTDVAGKMHLLPARAESQMSLPRRNLRNIVTFTDYRKFSADSSIDFKL